MTLVEYSKSRLGKVWTETDHHVLQTQVGKALDFAATPQMTPAEVDAMEREWDALMQKLAGS
jgi:hypothetical protein